MIEVQEIGFKKFGTELRRGWPPADFSWQCYYMLGNTNKLSVLFQLSSGVVVTLEIFFLGLSVSVMKINIKKSAKTRLNFSFNFLIFLKIFKDFISKK